MPRRLAHMAALALGLAALACRAGGEGGAPPSGVNPSPVEGAADRGAARTGAGDTGPATPVPDEAGGSGGPGAARTGTGPATPGAPAAAGAFDAAQIVERSAAGLTELSDASKRAWMDARRAVGAGDARGCLSALDRFDAAEPILRSTDPASPFAVQRAICEMQAGRCDAGKARARAALAQLGPPWGPDMISRAVDSYVSLYCVAPKAPRDRLLRATGELSRGAYMETVAPEVCQRALAELRAVVDVVQPTGPADTAVTSARDLAAVAGPKCLGRAGDCRAAHAAHRAWMRDDVRQAFDQVPADQRAAMIDENFAALVPECKRP